MYKKLYKIFSILVCLSLIFQQTGFAQIAAEFNIADQITQLHNSLIPDTFRPLHLRYLQYDSLNNNFKVLLDKGDSKSLKNQEIESTTKDLLDYFFTGIDLPNDTFWVNLRPDSPDNIIDPLLAKTEVGRILLEADLQLKKDTALATSPQTPEGREYWNKLYQKAEELYGTQNITIPTLTRPWIVPDEVIIRESLDSAYVYKATLKVMLEQDYLKGNTTYSFKDERAKELNEYSSQLIRETILPKLIKDVNNAKRYAPLRQVYYSLILAQWFKARNQRKDNQYSRIINRGDLSNLQSKTPYSVDTYFAAYKENFSKGEYNVQEPVYTPYGQIIRRYFSGGISGLMSSSPLTSELNKLMGAAGNKVVLPAASSSVSLKSGGNLLSVVVGVLLGSTVVFSQSINNDAHTGVSNPFDITASVTASAENNVIKLVQRINRTVDKDDRISALRFLSNFPIDLLSSSRIADKIISALTLSGQGIYDQDEDARGLALKILVNIAKANPGLAEKIVVLLTQSDQGTRSANKTEQIRAVTVLGKIAYSSSDSVLVKAIVDHLKQLYQDTDNPNGDLAVTAFSALDNALHAVPDLRLSDENSLNRLYQLFQLFEQRRADIQAQDFSPKDIITIWMNKDFMDATAKMNPPNKFSLAVGIEERLVINDRKVNDDNISKVLPSSLAIWFKQENRPVIGPESKVLAILGLEELFDPKDDADLCNKLKAKYTIYQGSPNPQEQAVVKEEVRRNIREGNFNVFLFDMHGLEENVWFDAFGVSTKESKNLHNPNALSYKELADDLRILADNNHGDLSKYTFIFSTCFSYALVVNTLDELVPDLKSGRITALPLFVTVTGRTLGYRITGSLAKLAEGKDVLRVKEFREEEAEQFYHQHIRIILPISKEDFIITGGMPDQKSPPSTTPAMPRLNPNVPVFSSENRNPFLPSASIIGLTPYSFSISYSEEQEKITSSAISPAQGESASSPVEVLFSGEEITRDKAILKNAAEQILSSTEESFKEEEFLLFGTQSDGKYGIQRIIPVLSYKQQSYDSIKNDSAYITDLIDQYATGDVKLLGVLHTHPFDVTKIITKPGPSWQDRLGEDILVKERADKIINTPLGIVIEAAIREEKARQITDRSLKVYFYLPKAGTENGIDVVKVLDFDEFIGEQGGIILDQPVASSPVESLFTQGGIDFRNLPIVTQSLDSLKVSIRAMPRAILERINLTQEWSDIERLVNSGITPSAERLKDYLVASCLKGELDGDMDKIISCIADILRMEEERCCSTDPTLKDILVVLGSGRSGVELKIALSIVT